MINRPDLLAAILLVAVLVITPVAAADVLLNEHMSYFEDYSESVTHNYGSFTQLGDANCIILNDIEKCKGLHYIGIVCKGSRPYLEEGRHSITYTMNGVEKEGAVYVDHMTNILGTVTGARFTLFFYDWDVSGLTGRQVITLSKNLGTFTIDRQHPVPTTGPGGLGVYYEFHGIYVGTGSVTQTFTIVSTINFESEIIVEDTGIAYEVFFNRYNTASYIEFRNNETVVYSDISGEDLDLMFVRQEFDEIYVDTLVGKEYTFPLGHTDPGDPSRVMVHIIAQDARNENLLLDAAVEVRDQYDAVVAAGTTSPEGWMVFEYDLPDTLTDEDFDRYYTVSVSLPGWTQKVTNFKFYPAFIPRSGDWIRVEMLPDTDGPADPEKTYIMFFVRDIHANPLERASIEIAGQYWHTNSAGHVAVEVPKNSTTAYTVRKTGHVSISGSAAVGAEGSYVVNIALGPALPDRTPGPGDDPGATPPPRDTRTNEEKGKAVIDLIADNAELIATLAILAAVMGLINLIMPGRRRR